ncbi:MAG: polymerase, sigma-24 subunit, subfamily [Acidimicrobiaceae bacterium]|nr:polymerase, sigma-24 subunit, subfamily [Acidimicrobiaceae bacterium]
MSRAARRTASSAPDLFPAGDQADGAGRPERLDRLASAARAGDRHSFERLVAETAPQLHALVLRLVGDEQDARDVVQETYLRAFRSIDRFRSEAAVTTWLYRIAANCSATHLSRRRPVLPLDAALHAVDDRPERDPEAVADQAVDRERLVAALGRLPEGLRAVVVLHDVYELTHDAVASELGITRAASKVRLHRARRRLRDQLFPPAEPIEIPGGRTGSASVRPLPALEPTARARAV